MTKDQIQTILDRHPNMPFEELGQRLGITGVQARYLCIKYGIRKEKGPWKRHSLDLSDDQIKHILETHSNCSLEEVAHKMGVTRPYVRTLYLKFGIERQGKTPVVHTAMEIAQSLAKPDSTISLEDAYNEAKKAKVSTSIMYAAIRRLGLKPVRPSDMLYKDGLRHCNDCHETKPLEEFYKDNSNRQGLAYRCKSCMLKNLAAFNKKKR